MKELFKFLLGLFYEWASSIRDKERNAEAKQHVADARERADERLKNSTTADRNARLERLSRIRPDHSSNGGSGNADSDGEEKTDPNPNSRVRGD